MCIGVGLAGTVVLNLLVAVFGTDLSAVVTENRGGSFLLSMRLR
jgi:hypothetical protein